MYTVRHTHTHTTGEHTETQPNTHADTVAMCSTDMHTADPVFVDLVAFEGPMYCRLTLLCITHTHTHTAAHKCVQADNNKKRCNSIVGPIWPWLI